MKDYDGLPALLYSPHESSHGRHRREAPGGTFDNTFYLDAIGVPHGVPDDFKAHNQIAAGWEFLFPTINKNVDWMNFLFYNQQRFVNFTRDAAKGIVRAIFLGFMCLI